MERREKKHLTASSFGMVHGSEWKSTHALGDQSTCVACHDNKKCGQCHGAGVPHDRHIIVKHSSAARDEAQRCSSCHKEQSFCDSCHGIEMPHPESFLKSHSDITKRDGQELCNRCHHPEDCTNCHAAHIHPGGAANPGGTVGANR